MARAFLKVFFDFEERTEALSETERGRLLLGMLRYARTGEEPELTGSERVIWPVFRAEIDREIASYETRIANGRQGGRPPKNETGTEADETGENRKKPKITERKQNAQEQEQEQEKEINPDDDDDIRAREEAVRESFRENFGRSGTPEEVRQISVAANLYGMDTDVAGEAVQKAATHGARSPAAYVKRILEEWRHAGVRTVEDAVRYQMDENCRTGRALVPFAVCKGG